LFHGRVSDSGRDDIDVVEDRFGFSNFSKRSGDNRRNFRLLGVVELVDVGVVTF